MMKSRTTSSPPLTSLYSQVRTKMHRPLSQRPRIQSRTGTAGTAASNAGRVCSADTRPEGMGRQDMFTRSSRIELGERWFARSKKSTLTQLKRMMSGVRRRICSEEGAGPWTRWGAARAPKMPKAALGSAKVLNSLSEKAQISLRVSNTRLQWFS